MRLLQQFIFITTILMTMYTCKTYEPAPILPMEDFFKNPEKTAYRISPDGRYYSFMAPYENRMNIFVQEIGQDSLMQISYETDRDISWYMWANNNRLLYLKDEAGNEDFKLYASDLDGSDNKCLTCFEGVRTLIFDDLEDIPDEIIIGLNKRDPHVFDPYRLNIVTGEMKMLAENPGNIMDWILDHDGKLRAALALDGIDQTLLFRETEEDEFKPVFTTSYMDNFSVHFFTFDNKNLYLSSDIGRDKQNIVIIDPRTGEETDTLFSHDEVDVTGLGYSRKRKTLTAAYYYTDKKHYEFFDDTFKKIVEDILSNLDNVEIAFTGTDKEETKFIVRSYSDKTRGAYYIYDIHSRSLDKLHDVSPWLDEKNMAEMKPVRYTTRDSLTIHGYLTLPVGRKPKDLPVVILPHGGPWVRDYWGFDSEVQFLANRGYGVLQMNYRGSTGYGKEFWLKSKKQWGRKMQDDITDGVYWLIDEGIADKNRVAIYGGSYGGYATLAGLAFTPDIYACGVDYVGVSNMFTFMKTIPPYWEPFRQMQYELVGHPEKDSLMLAEVSPVFHVEKIKAPLFIAQGANDPRVNKNESDQMVDALKKRGIDIEYLVKDNEGHGFRNEENRFDFYRAMESFLEKHIGNK